jgi:hypothetical protein
MRFVYKHLALGTVLAFGLAGCGGAGSEPTEAQMKEAMDYAMNHPPGETVSDPVKIVFFKKEACDAPDTARFPLHLRCEGRLSEHRRLHVQQHLLRLLL